MIHAAMTVLAGGAAGMILACVMGYSEIFGFAWGPLAYFSELVLFRARARD